MIRDHLYEPFQIVLKDGLNVGERPKSNISVSTLVVPGATRATSTESLKNTEA
jgi:hypothetical protein